MGASSQDTIKAGGGIRIRQRNDCPKCPVIAKSSLAKMRQESPGRTD